MAETYRWVQSETGGPKDLELFRGEECVGWVEQEIERKRHDPSTDTPTGRWVWFGGGLKGVTRQRAAAMRRAEQMAKGA